MTSYFDTCAIIAMLNPSETHHAWSVQKFNEYKAQGPAIISDIVYCELSIGMPSIVALDKAVSDLGLQRSRPSKEALFSAGRAFMKYKKNNSGKKTGVLSDFFIGAEADAAKIPLVTANPDDISGYFPSVSLVSP